MPTDFIINSRGVLENYTGGSESVTLPDTVIELGARAFAGCAQLAEVTITGTVIFQKKVFPDCRPVLTAPCMPVTAFNPEDRPGAVCGFAKLYCDRAELADDIYAGYLKYIRRQRKRLYKKAVQFPALLTLMVQEKIIPQEDFDTVWALAEARQDTGLTAMLLEYQQQNLKRRDLQEEFEKQIKIIETGILPVSEAKKFWRFEKKKNGTLCITGYKGTETRVAVPAAIGSAKVTELGDRAFSPAGCYISEDIRRIRREIEYISVSKGVKAIGRCCFEECAGLVGIDLPAGLKKIGLSCFHGCSKLTEIVLPKALRTLPVGLFKDCTALARAELYSNITEIDPRAFDNCPNLQLCFTGEHPNFRVQDGALLSGTGEFVRLLDKTVDTCTIPEDITKIGWLAFFGSNVARVIIPDSVTEIGESAFEDCKFLAAVQIPDSVTRIGKDAFSNCTRLDSIDIPESVTKIEDRTFFNCFYLKDITIPASVTETGEDIFGRSYWPIPCAAVTIHAPAGSYAEHYAKINKIQFAAGYRRASYQV